MPDYSKRTGYAPWSLTREAGVQSATVNGTIDVPQTCQPTINTGVIDEKGNWQGVKANDEVFIGISKAEGVANGGDALFPNTPNFPSIDMTGFNDIYFALKPTAGGDYGSEAVMGPDTETFANLSPVNSGTILRGLVIPFGTATDLEKIYDDAADTMTANVWNIFPILTVLKGQKNLQFKITNNSGSNSDIEFGFMRLV
jgi:hypothetical protein